MSKPKSIERRVEGDQVAAKMKNLLFVDTTEIFG